MVDVSSAFPFLAGLMLTVLDRCQSAHDVDSILTSMMLAHSFYRVREPVQLEDEEEAVSTGKATREDAEDEAYASARSRREYLKAAIQSHPVWGDASFWREALTICVAKQRRVSNAAARRPRSHTRRRLGSISRLDEGASSKVSLSLSLSLSRVSLQSLSDFAPMESPRVERRGAARAQDAFSRELSPSPPPRLGHSCRAKVFKK